LDLSGCGKGREAGSCEHGNKALGSIKVEEIFHYLKEYFERHYELCSCCTGCGQISTKLNEDLGDETYVLMISHCALILASQSV
jgi:hypothetical protein